jgi:hypothetical protein
MCWWNCPFNKHTLLTRLFVIENHVISQRKRRYIHIRTKLDYPLTIKIQWRGNLFNVIIFEIGIFGHFLLKVIFFGLYISTCNTTVCSLFETVLCYCPTLYKYETYLLFYSGNYYVFSIYYYCNLQDKLTSFFLAIYEGSIREKLHFNVVHLQLTL